MSDKPRKIYPLVLLIAACACLGKAFWIEAKALAAQQLIAQAWQKSLSNGRFHPPWQWADTYPVIRLITPEQQSLYVLDSVSGQALAFGPGQLSGSAQPGEVGSVVLAGHRDTHFRFLEHTSQGDIFRLENIEGRIFDYQVSDIRIVDSSEEDIVTSDDYANLQLISCYPFNSVSEGGPLRYVVHAELI